MKKLKKKAIALLKISAVATLAYKSLQGQAKDIMIARAQAAAERARRNERMREHRLRTAGPLGRSAQRLLNITVQVLNEAFFETNYQLDPTGTVDYFVYLFACFLYWRFRMEDSLMKEVVLADDYWQFSVDHAVGEVMTVLRTPTEVRVSLFQGRAVAELMPNGDPTQSDCSPISFTRFAELMHNCLREGGAADMDAETRRWARWIKPFWISVDRYAKLVMKLPRGYVRAYYGTDSQSLTVLGRPEDRVFVRETMDKLADLTRELTDLVYVLEKNPADRWFRQKRELVDDKPNARPKELRQILSKVSAMKTLKAHG
eukprot:CAMPEP_0118927756 /NCGR_PEP_ID=MMETSP1169-20130426/5165_1 /TAXON_ID=36882 /ORGANISM="Pyramimonas obovata, Strain CCMP722" /LENGTH=315 /DNA_ID=CAMNT_0006869591 /DNA_START=148 /DNA_END=1095 /DNA_ORIENTATION=-